MSIQARQQAQKEIMAGLKLGKWCRLTYKQSKIRSDSWSWAAAVAALLAVETVRLLEKGSSKTTAGSDCSDQRHICASEERSLRVGSRTTSSAGTKESRTQRCRIVFNDLHQMVLEALKKST